MPYIEEFRNRIRSENFPRFLQLWEEYSNAESVDPEEFMTILEMIQSSDLAAGFGKYVETALPLWSTFKDTEASYPLLKILIDLQTTNVPLLSEIANETLKEKYGGHPKFDTFLKLVGLRGIDSFQGALSNFDLLVHLKKGNFVYHHAGWGTGEVLEVSLVREQIILEFENIMGKRDLSFVNAFKTLTPLPGDHFLARRFGNPDDLEEEAKKNPVGVINLLLKDIGPKTAQEIKDELCEWVIPEEEWTKWWQGARSRLKKDTMVDAPSKIKAPFRLRKTELTHEVRLHEEIIHAKEVKDVLLSTYNFVRDFPNMLKKEEIKTAIVDKLKGFLDYENLPKDEEIQIVLFLENLIGEEIGERSLEELVRQIPDYEQAVNEVPIVAMKKQLIIAIRKYCEEWPEIYSKLMLTLPQNTLKDYLLKELYHDKTIPQLREKLGELLKKPVKYPESFIWFFQKVIGDYIGPYGDKEGQCQFMEGLLILLHQLEMKPSNKELVKKISVMLTAKRYAVIRKVLEDSPIEFAKEFLLLASKCQSFSHHDLKVMHSLVEVVHPSLASQRKEEEEEPDLSIWTTEDGYKKTVERMERIHQVEIVENAREIEAARALGDLRENSEYKFALERRSRLQGELKMLSDQVKRAKIISPHEVEIDRAGIGTVIELIDLAGKRETYSILGPWDADTEKNIISFQSKLAEAMIGKQVGDEFSFRHQNYQIANIRSYFDQQKV